MRQRAAPAKSPRAIVTVLEIFGPGAVSVAGRSGPLALRQDRPHNPSCVSCRLAPGFVMAIVMLYGRFGPSPQPELRDLPSGPALGIIVHRAQAVDSGADRPARCRRHRRDDETRVSVVPDDHVAEPPTARNHTDFRIAVDPIPFEELNLGFTEMTRRPQKAVMVQCLVAKAKQQMVEKRLIELIPNFGRERPAEIDTGDFRRPWPARGA